MKVSKSGFTIVELLIVIVVIAILAAISLVAYNGIQNRSHDSSVKSDLSTIAKKIGLYHANTGMYPSEINQLAPGSLYEVKINKNSYASAPLTNSNLHYCTMSPYSSYALLARSKTGTMFYILNGTIMTSSTTSTTCSDYLTGSAYIFPAGYSNPDWRPWTGASV